MVQRERERLGVRGLERDRIECRFLKRERDSREIELNVGF